MQGECLCGAVRFAIAGDLPNLYQCHCSLCRKVTGSTANAATFVRRDDFRWLSGEDRIRSFRKPTGYRSDFCEGCGSPVPNRLGDSDLVWVPVGLLEGDVASEIAVHLHRGSAASWERDAADGISFAAGPDSLEALHRALQRTDG